MSDTVNARWRRSSWSGGTGNCVEVTDHLPDVVAVRDSKDPDGPVLMLSLAAWNAFIEGVRAGEFAARRGGRQDPR